MRGLLFVVALAWAGFSGVAHAAMRICSGDAGDTGKGRVSVVIRWDGKAWERFAVWYPAPAGGEAFPMLSVFYDLAPEGLGPPGSVRIAALLDAEILPESKTADVLVALDGEPAWRRPWGMYAQNVQAMREGKVRLPKGSRLASFTGSVPMAFARTPDGDSLNTDLLAELPAAKSLEARVEGDTGEDLGRNRFDLTATSARDALFREALAKASEAAKTPQTCREEKD